MPRYGIAPQLSSHWFPDGHPYDIGLHHCGKCMNPFLTGDDCACACHKTPTETRGINRSAAVNTSGEGLGGDDKLGPQTGTEREEKNDE